MKRKRTSRSLHGISWKNDLSWMDSMKGSRWNSFLESEKKEFHSLANAATHHTSFPLLQKELESSLTLSQAPLLYSQSKSIQVCQKGSFTYSWNWIPASTFPSLDAADIYVKGSLIWTIEDVGEGAEIYALRLRTKTSQTPVWEVKGVAPFFSVLGNRCYCLMAKNTLVYYKLISIDAFSGKDMKIHYIEEDYRYNLFLRGSFLKRQSGEKEDAFEILPNGTLTLLDSISLESRRFVFDIASNHYIQYTTSSKKDDKSVVESFNSSLSLYVKKSGVVRSLYKDSKKIWEGVGQILLDPFGGPWVRFIQPGHEIVWWDASSQTLPSFSIPIDILKSSLRNIPYVLVLPEANIPLRNVLVIGYGAYGIPTPLNTFRWKPLLQRGWAIGIGFWRGGGDLSAKWEDLGRVKGREDVLLDAEDVVRSIQTKLALSSNHTYLYGRSAGGLWVGGLMAKYPNGSLAAGSYMEVPYLDVLQTTTNRSLPLTNIETDEFGLPEQRVSDLRSIVEWSPMELLLQTKKPKTSFQLIRTGENDSEVLAYESAKWVHRWNENSKRSAWLALGKSQGHFVSGSSSLEQQATDLGILLFFAAKNRNTRYKMASRKNMTRRNRKNARKNTRKNRKSRRANRK
jgi:hypothetical protein